MIICGNPVVEQHTPVLLTGINDKKTRSMIDIRKANTRGHFENDWLNSYHTFSFGDYHDPEYMGVSVLRVINDDTVVPGAGFATHPHKNMEIVSYVLTGELAHKDSMGNGSVIKPGDVQCMSAGTGVTHSEFNPSDSASTNFLQIWLLPNQQNVTPSYAQKYFAPDARRGQLTLLVSPDGTADSIRANTDARMYGAILASGDQIQHKLDSERQGYFHVAQGELEMNGQILSAGDGATFDAETTLRMTAESHAEILLFDLPKRA